MLNVFRDFNSCYRHSTMIESEIERKVQMELVLNLKSYIYDLNNRDRLQGIYTDSSDTISCHYRLRNF